MATISQLGKKGLVDRITNGLPRLNKSSAQAAADDCAVLSYGDTRLLVSTQLLLEGIHFDLVYTPLKHLGYKAAVVALSNLAAMNATPRQLLVGIGLSSRFSVESVDEIVAGLRLACERYGADLVGGDTTASLTGLTLSVTAIGEADEAEITRRMGAQENDIICVSGDLGAAYMGLQLLEREKAVFAGKAMDEAAAQPDFSGREYLLERFLKPEARFDVLKSLREAGLRPTSMIDLSEGLASGLMYLCEASGTGCRIYEERIPLDYQTASCAEEFNMNVSTCALNGGSDYELLFTLPLSDHDKIGSLKDVHEIGYMTRSALGTMLVGRGDAQEIELKAQAWT